MYLAQARVFGVAPFGDVQFPFCDAKGDPRLLTVIHGGGGVGKTALLYVLAHTRPGYAAVLQRVTPLRPDAPHPPFAVCDWHLGDDDPQRPHALSIITPNARLAEDDERVLLRRREQTLFDRKSKDGGFVFLTIASARWFSQQPVALYAPLRTVGQYDVRSTTNLDDATRSDLTREVKQALAYAGIAAALAPHNQRERTRLRERDQLPVDTRLLGTAMREMVDALVQLVGYRYEGIDPTSLEPTFSTPGGRLLVFDQLPTRARHLVAFAALPVRTLWAAYPGRDPRTAPGVVAIDEVDLHQDPTVQEQLVATLRSCLPQVQWILTTTSPLVAAACDANDVLALRRLPETEHIELFLGDQALTH